MVKIYKQPFAHDGDTIEIPDASQPDGKMSSADGWTPDYQLPRTDPNYKPVGRQEMNGVFKEVTEALGQVQVQGAASWSADGAPYPANAQVYHGGKQWLALRDNSVEPTEGEDWSAVMTQKAVTDALDAKANQMTGSISAFASTIAPEGWLKANGAELLRADYPELWVYAQSSGNLATQASKEAGNFGDGDGSTTFTIPDIRGEFIRGFDDGRGIDSGRAIGSFQDWALKDHGHNISFSAEGGGLRTVYGGQSTGATDRTALIPSYNAGIRTATEVGGAQVPPHERVSLENISGDETRPRNVALLYCIKY